MLARARHRVEKLLEEGGRLEASSAGDDEDGGRDMRRGAACSGERGATATAVLPKNGVGGTGGDGGRLRHGEVEGEDDGRGSHGASGSSGSAGVAEDGVARGWGVGGRGEKEEVRQVAGGEEEVGRVRGGGRREAVLVCGLGCEEAVREEGGAAGVREEGEATGWKGEEDKRKEN